MPQVENVMRISAPYKFVSKEFRKEKTLIRVNGTLIGANEFVVIAEFPRERGSAELAIKCGVRDIVGMI